MSVTFQRVNPADMPAPLSTYSQGVVWSGASRTLEIAGQVGVLSDGSVPDSIEAQIAATWDNIDRILRDAGMTRANVVRVRGYLVREEDVGAYRDAFVARYADVRPVSTLVIVKSFVSPRFLVEIDAVAVA